MATAPSRIRPLWILLLSELSEASEEEAVGIFFSNVVCFFMCCFSLIIFCSLRRVKKKNKTQLRKTLRREAYRYLTRGNRKRRKNELWVFPSTYTPLPPWVSLSQVWPLRSLSMGQCRPSGGSWLSSLPGTTSLQRPCLGGRPVSSPSALPGHPAGPFPERQGRGEEVRERNRLGRQRETRRWKVEQGHSRLSWFWLLSEAGLP